MNTPPTPPLAMTDPVVSMLTLMAQPDTSKSDYLSALSLVRKLLEAESYSPDRDIALGAIADMAVISDSIGRSVK